MAIYNLERGMGKGKKLAAVSASITGTGTVATGLTSIDYAVANAASGTTIPVYTATAASTSGGDVTVVVISNQTTTNAVATTAKTVTVFAVGE